MGVEQVKKALQEALAQVRSHAQQVGRGPGGRELSLALVKLEEAESWVDRSSSAPRESLQAPGNLAAKQD